MPNDHIASLRAATGESIDDPSLTPRRRRRAHARRDPKSEDPPSDDDLLDEDAAANLLDVAPGTLSVWRSTGRYELPFIKVGRNVRYRRGTLLSWREARTRNSGTTA